MDALSDVLRITRLKGGVFLHAEFTQPWCLGVTISAADCSPYLGEVSDIIPYHFVIDGTLRVKTGTEPPNELGPGEVVLFPRNDSHLLGGDLNLSPVSGDDVVRPPSTEGGLSTIRMGGNGDRTTIVCGFLGGDALESNPLINTLPPMLHMDVGKGNSGDWIRGTFSYAADEIASGRMGSETVLAKISEILFVEAIRHYSENLPEGEIGWLAALKDPQLSKGLALMHSKLNFPWTVDDLGREVGLSRSALADRFVQLIGIPPIQYLTNWRMQVAAQNLRNSIQSIQQIAEQVGYDSEAAFSRAFKRVMKVPPATWRRQESKHS